MRISIVLCNYNYAMFLDSAIRSAVEQDHPDKEVIVVDDGSTDASRQIIDGWGSKILSVLKANEGQVSAYNAGFAQVTGDVVIFLDSDDLLDRNACGRVAEAFQSAPAAAKVHFYLRLIDQDGRHLGPTIPRCLAEGDVSERLRRFGELYDSAPGSGNAYRVAALRRLMPLPGDQRDRHGADFFAIYGTSLIGEVRLAGAQPLGSYRLHQGGASTLIALGNAAKATKEPQRTYARYARLQAWLWDRLGEHGVLPSPAPAFSLEKQAYAAAIFSAPSYMQGLRGGSRLLASSLLPAIARTNGSMAFRVGLTCWAMAILMLPRVIGLPLARYVCNPASR
jgi:glycosyltransferase involved in cell wall biosynthesis